MDTIIAPLMLYPTSWRLAPDGSRRRETVELARDGEFDADKMTETLLAEFEL
jgi:hypothetical protein